MEMRASQVIKGALGGGAKKRKKVQDWGRNREREDEKEGERHFPTYVAVWDVTIIYRQRWKKSHVLYVFSTWSQRSLLGLIKFVIVAQISEQKPSFLIYKRTGARFGGWTEQKPILAPAQKCCTCRCDSSEARVSFNFVDLETACHFLPLGDLEQFLLCKNVKNGESKPHVRAHRSAAARNGGS